jgi:hypothetical protein
MEDGVFCESFIPFTLEFRTIRSGDPALRDRHLVRQLTDKAAATAS